MMCTKSTHLLLHFGLDRRKTVLLWCTWACFLSLQGWQRGFFHMLMLSLQFRGTCSCFCEPVWNYQWCDPIMSNVVILEACAAAETGCFAVWSQVWWGPKYLWTLRLIWPHYWYEYIDCYLMSDFTLKSRKGSVWLCQHHTHPLFCNQQPDCSADRRNALNNGQIFTNLDVDKPCNPSALECQAHHTGCLCLWVY